jgi:hypothetical protein
MLLDKVVSSYHHAPCFLLVINDNICGMAALTAQTSPWNGDVSFTDYMFYVQPEHRSIKHLNALVEKSKEFASLHDTSLRLEFATEVSEEIRKRLFRMNGLKVESITGAYYG